MKLATSFMKWRLATSPIKMEACDKFHNKQKNFLRNERLATSFIKIEACDKSNFHIRDTAPWGIALPTAQPWVTLHITRTYAVGYAVPVPNHRIGKITGGDCGPTQMMTTEEVHTVKSDSTYSCTSKSTCGGWVCHRS